MKAFKTLPKITVELGAEASRDFTMLEWLEVAIHSNKLFGKGFTNIVAGIALLDSLKQQFEDEESDEIVLEDEQFSKLKDSVALCEWNPKVAFALFPFFKAIEDAKDYKAPSPPTK